MKNKVFEVQTTTLEGWKTIGDGKFSTQAAAEEFLVKVCRRHSVSRSELRVHGPTMTQPSLIESGE